MSKYYQPMLENHQVLPCASPYDDEINPAPNDGCYESIVAKAIRLTRQFHDLDGFNCYLCEETKPLDEKAPDGISCKYCFYGEE